MDPRAPDLNPYASPAIASFVPGSDSGSIIRTFKKHNRLLFNLGAIVGVFWLPMVVGILGTKFLPGRVALVALPLLLTGMWFTCVFIRCWTDFRYGSLGRKIASRLRTEQIDPFAWNGQFVQFAPAGQLRLFDLHTEYDDGYFFMFHDWCTFLGDQTRFSIPRSAIHDVSIGYGTVEPPFAYQIRVHWRNPATNCDDTLSIWPGVPKSVLRRHPQAMEFAEQISSWVRADNRGLDAPDWSRLPCPQLEAVESKSMDEAYPLWSVFVGILSALIVVLVGITWVSSLLEAKPDLWWLFSSGSSVVLLFLISILPRLFLRNRIS